MIAFVFPGQGSQEVGMGKELADSFHRVRHVFEEADEALGFSLSKLCFEGPEEELKHTANAQPAILTMSIAVLREIEQAAGVAPEIVAGHSLGEYSALVCAGAMSFADAVRIVRRRGQLMQQAVPVGQGSMAAILNMDREAVEQLCRDAAEGQVLSPANYNATKQVVVAGQAEAVERAMQLAPERGGTGTPLNVSAPFHSSLMEPAAKELAEELQQIHFSAPKVPVINNVEAQPYRDSSELAAMLVRQVTSPVQWIDSVRKMKEMGVTDVVEIGPGAVLIGLIEKIDDSLRRINMGTHEEVFCCHRILNEARRQGLLDAGWTPKGKVLISPDRTRILMEQGWIWDASDYGSDPGELSPKPGAAAAS